jgi:hypothetical protein
LTKETAVAVHGLASPIPFLQLPLALPNVHGDLTTGRKLMKSQRSLQLTSMFCKRWLITCSRLWNLLSSSVARSTPARTVYYTVLTPSTTTNPGMTMP